MTHDELLAKIAKPYEYIMPTKALRAVVELHKPLKDNPDYCDGCYEEEGGHNYYPCPTIQAIEKELNNG
jgi:hypothetical protein